MVFPGISPCEKKDRPHGRFDRYRLGRVDNGLSDKTKMTFVVCQMADTASGMFCQQDFLRRNKKKRDVGYSALVPDVLWLEILQTLRFYREGESLAIKGVFPYKRIGVRL